MMKFMYLFNFFLLNYYIFLNLIILMMMMIPIKFNNFHPLKLMIMLIFLIFMISLKMNFIYKSWMNFFVVMIMIGGLMVIFMYITSLNNNMMFKFMYLSILKNIVKFFFMLLLFFFMIKVGNYVFLFNVQDLWSLNFNLMEEKNDYFLMKLFNIYKSSMFFIMLYLYYSLICIMNICYKLKSPLRQIYY